MSMWRFAGDKLFALQIHLMRDIILLIAQMQPYKHTRVLWLSASFLIELLILKYTTR